jgi:hypothetical protein
MKCGARDCTKDRPDLLEESLPAEHKKAIELSTGPVPTTRWECSCGWARYVMTAKTEGQAQ